MGEISGKTGVRNSKSLSDSEGFQFSREGSDWFKSKTGKVEERKRGPLA